MGSRPHSKCGRLSGWVSYNRSRSASKPSSARSRSGRPKLGHAAASESEIQPSRTRAPVSARRRHPAWGTPRRLRPLLDGEARSRGRAGSSRRRSSSPFNRAAATPAFAWKEWSAGGEPEPPVATAGTVALTALRSGPQWTSVTARARGRSSAHRCFCLTAKFSNFGASARVREADMATRSSSERVLGVIGDSLGCRVG